MRQYNHVGPVYGIPAYLGTTISKSGLQINHCQLWQPFVKHRQYTFHGPSLNVDERPSQATNEDSSTTGCEALVPHQQNEIHLSSIFLNFMHTLSCIVHDS